MCSTTPHSLSATLRASPSLQTRPAASARPPAAALGAMMQMKINHRARRGHRENVNTLCALCVLSG